MRKLSAVLIGSTVVALAVTGCANGQPAARSSRPVYLTVHLGLFGGPARPNGTMALVNGSDPGAPITVADSTGRTWTVKTDHASLARFQLHPGRYTIKSPTCGHGPRHVIVRVDRRVQLRCDVP